MKTTLILVLVAFTFSLFSQNNKIDSLHLKLINTKGGEHELVLDQLAGEYERLLTDYYRNPTTTEKSRRFVKKLIIANESISRKELAAKIVEFKIKYETKKKEPQIILQKDILKEKDRLNIFIIVAGSIIFAAFVVIYILYKIKNKAYKQLVYQSLQNVNITLPLEEYEDETLNDENKNDLKHNHTLLDEKIKSQIEISLNHQLDLKTFINPDITLKMLAEKCHTNRSYLSLFINERYAMNFNTFINSLRINEAKQILSDPNNSLPLKELYLRLGYNSYSVFNEAFKKHVGVTPAFYLKTIKNLSDVSNLN